MAGTRLISCVLHLFAVLLITTVHGQSTEIALNCPNQKVTVGETLRLNCSVTCETCTPLNCKWKNTNAVWTKMNCSIEQKPTESTSGRIFICSYTIFNASKEHNGTFRFWIQTTNGANETKFKVTIVLSQPSYKDPLHSTSEKQTDGRSATVAVAVIIMFLVVIGLMVALFLRKNCNNMPISEKPSHKLTLLT